jgi:hypothetical protein
MAGRLSRLVFLGLGGVAGVAISAGWWCWRVWQLTGNPLFPYYNDIFHSPLYWNERFVFRYFLPRTWIETILYPFIWLFDSTRVSEMRFVHLGIPGLMALAALVGVFRLLGVRPQGAGDGRRLIPALGVFWLIAYVLWLTQFSVYRFAVLIEMLAPLLVAGILARWVPPALQAGRIILFLLLIAVITWPANFGRYAFADRYMAMTPVNLPQGTMVAVAGWSPLSYLVIAFPPETPFVRIQSNMHGFVDRPNGTDTLARNRLLAHQGPIRLLLAEAEWPIAEPLIKHSGYTVDKAACQVVEGTLAGGGGAGRLHLCPMTVP